MNSHFSSTVVKNEVSFIPQRTLEEFDLADVLLYESLDREPLVAHCWRNISLVDLHLVSLFRGLKSLFWGIAVVPFVFLK